MQHPSVKQLESYAKGLGTTDFRKAVGSHLKQCKSCAQLLTQLELDLEEADVAPEELQLGGTADRVPELNLPLALVDHETYEVVRLLGAGGMGRVFKVRHRLTGRYEVLKLLSPDLANQPRIRQRFLLEIRAAAKLDHPNVVRVLNAFELDGMLAYVMEFNDGEDLGSVIKQNGRIGFQVACNYVIDVCKGLGFAHRQGMIHRDIKPSNLLLSRQDSGNPIVKILDFGLARLKEQDDGGDGDCMTRDGRILGTPEYMSPEQATHATRADERSDIYSLGCTLYAMLVGRPPFQETSKMATIAAHISQLPLVPSRYVGAIPAALDRIVMKLLAKRPQDRFQTVSDVENAISRFLKEVSSIGAEEGSRIRSSANEDRASHNLRNVAVGISKNPIAAANNNVKNYQKRALSSSRNSLLSILTLGLIVPLLVTALMLTNRESLHSWVMQNNFGLLSSYLIVRSCPEGVNLLLDGQPLVLIEAESSNDKRIPVSPGTHVIDILKEGRLLSRTEIQIEFRQIFELNVEVILKSNRLDKRYVGPVPQPHKDGRSKPNSLKNSREPNSSEQLIPRLEADEALSAALACLKQWNPELALEKLRTSSSFEADQLSEARHLIQVATEIKQVDDLLRKAFRLIKPNDAFYFDYPPVLATVVDVTESSIKLDYDQKLYAFNLEELPFSLKVALSEVATSLNEPELLKSIVGWFLRETEPLDKEELSYLSEKRIAKLKELAGIVRSDAHCTLLKDMDPIPQSETHEFDHTVESLGETCYRLTFIQDKVLTGEESLLISTGDRENGGRGSAIVWNLGSRKRENSEFVTEGISNCQVSRNGRIVALSILKGRASEVNVVALPYTMNKSKKFNVPTSRFNTHLSSDGRELSILDANGNYLKHNLQTGKLSVEVQAQMPSKEAPVTELMIAPSTSFFAMCNKKHDIYVFHASTGKLIWSDTSDLPIAAVYFSSDSKNLIVIRTPGLMEIYDNETGGLLKEFRGHTASIVASAISANYRYVITGDVVGHVRIWDTLDMKLLTSVRESDAKKVSAVGYDSVRQTIALGFDDLSVRLWKAKKSGLRP
jgi:serine/threonine protein kinase/WD40 repeat protein